MAIDKKFHINSKGEAKPCNANVYACRFGDDSHFSTMSEAVAESEKRLSKEDAGKVFGGLSKKAKNGDAETIAALRERFEKFDLKDMNSQNLMKVGEVFDDELKNRLSFDPYEDELSAEQWEEVEKETHELMGQIFDNGSALENKVYGTMAKALDKAVAVLPDSVKKSLSSTKILAKSIRKDAMDRDGMHEPNARFRVNVVSESYEPSPFEKEDAENVPEGSFYVKGFNMESDFKENGFGIRASIKVDDNTSRPVWIGKPFGKSSGKKIADNAEIFINRGRKIETDLPVYEVKDDYAMTGSVISAKKFSDDSSQNSVLLHEYTHLVQQYDYSGAERHMFDLIKQDSMKVYDEDQSMRVYNGFPDEYMGLSNGRELLTRASEGLFYPSSAQYLYGVRKGENADRVRQWVAGYWIARGLRKNDDAA